MALDQNAINELKEICLKEFGKMPTDQEAWDMGIGLINLFKALAGFEFSKKVESSKDLTGDKPKS